MVAQCSEQRVHLPRENEPRGWISNIRVHVWYIEVYEVLFLKNTNSFLAGVFLSAQKSLVLRLAMYDMVCISKFVRLGNGYGYH